MADFHYSAIDSDGRTRHGRIAAETPEAARAVLLRRKLFALRVDDAEGAVPEKAAGARLNDRQLTLFTRQLATLAPVSPLAEALRTIARQTEAPRVRAVIGRIHGGVVEGRRLADAMALEPHSFPPLFRAMVSAGESSGALPALLERLALLLERQASVRGRVMASLAYPAALAVVALLVVVALMLFVVPRVVEQFDDIGQTLPLLTRIVIAISEALQAWWWLLAGLAIVGGLAFARAMRDETWRRGFDGWLLTLPLFGRLLRDLHAARLARTLATMVAARLPLVEGLALAAATVSNRRLRAASEEIAVSIREGSSLGSALRVAGVFPPLLVHMAAGGESAGALDTMLERAADYLEREFDTYTSTALSLLEPTVIIAMGVAVATIVLAILLPILQLDTLATG